VIDKMLCTGCGLCCQVCKIGAIRGAKPEIPFGLQLKKKEEGIQIG
jgi:ferredoxin